MRVEKGSNTALLAGTEKLKCSLAFYTALHVHLTNLRSTQGDKMNAALGNAI